jgi:hypothetical protein
MPTITGPIVPSSALFAAVDDAYVKGGFRVVDTVATMNAIPAPRRKAGMRVHVQATGNLYKLGGDLTTWQIISEDDSPPKCEWFGGVSDGAIDANTGSVTGTDNRAAIQACLDEYGECNLGDGIYALSGYVSSTDPEAKLVGNGKSRTTLALLDDAAIAHADLFPWGTFYPDTIYAGSQSTGQTIQGIHFYGNGFNRRVADKAGYDQPGSRLISITGYGQKVIDCKFSGMAAHSGSTAGARTPGLPEAFVVVLTHPPGVGGWSDEWVYETGAIVDDCEFVGPLAPQTDPDDFATTGTATPEITFILIGGMSVTWNYGTGSVALGGTTLTTTSNYFESWMAGKRVYIGGERLEIASVDSATQATLAAPAAAAHTGETVQVLRRTRILQQSPRVSNCKFENLKIWRTSDTDKQLRALHLITMADHYGATVENNTVVACDSVFYYQDAWVAWNFICRNNVLLDSLYGFGMGFASYALTTTAGCGWWYNFTVSNNLFRHGNRAMARMYSTFSDKAGNTFRMSDNMGYFANGLTIVDSNTAEEFADFFQPATTTSREQVRCVDTFIVSNNDIQVVDDLYLQGVWYLSAYSSNTALTYASITDNIVDHWTWNDISNQFGQVTNDGIIRAAAYGSQYRIGFNQRATGDAVPLYSVSGSLEVWPQVTLTPTGFTNDIDAVLTWSTLSAAFAALVPDGSGFVWYGNNDKAGAGINLRYEYIEWAGDNTYPLKLVLPKPVTTTGLGVGEIMAGTALTFCNKSSTGTNVELHWNKAGTPTLIRTVAVNEVVELMATATGYRWNAFTPDASGNAT